MLSPTGAVCISSAPTAQQNTAQHRIQSHDGSAQRSKLPFVLQAQLQMHASAQTDDVVSSVPCRSPICIVAMGAAAAPIQLSPSHSQCSGASSLTSTPRTGPMAAQAMPTTVAPRGRFTTGWARKAPHILHSFRSQAGLVPANHNTTTNTSDKHEQLSTTLCEGKQSQRVPYYGLV